MKLSKKTILNLSMAALSLSLLTACSSTPTVSYVDPNSVDTTSIDFSSTDLQSTVQQMVNQMLTAPVVVQLTAKTPPVLYVAGMTNNTSEHIDTNAITDSISTRLINSGQFTFVDMTKVAAIKQQMAYQHTSGMVDQQTAVAMGQQIGAQYMFYGDVSSISAANSNQQSMYYQITMKLLSIKTGVIVWQGEQQIRKVAVRKTFGW
ncbi:MAG: penicillin-binding protein activator LpoB [Gammaproteobacteria bacterium]|nr:penicillin-binding protein activator LpoB [Gammaproteobacteria bacterium]